MNCVMCEHRTNQTDIAACSCARNGSWRGKLSFSNFERCGERHKTSSKTGICLLCDGYALFRWNGMHSNAHTHTSQPRIVSLRTSILFAEIIIIIKWNACWLCFSNCGCVSACSPFMGALTQGHQHKDNSNLSNNIWLGDGQSFPTACERT